MHNLLACFTAQFSQKLIFGKQFTDISRFEMLKYGYNISVADDKKDQKERFRVFKIGENVVCGSKGVCTVENITTLTMPGVDREREYYILKPKYMSGSTVYVPVDSPKESMRRVMEREEAQELLKAIPKLPMLEIENEKFAEQTYRECMKTGKCEEWARLLKTVWERREKRIQSGRKVTAVDDKYFHIAEDSLYGELAVALDINRGTVGEYIENEMKQRMDV